MRHLLPDPPAVEEKLPRFDTPNVLRFFGAIATASASNAVVADVHPSASSSSSRSSRLFGVLVLIGLLLDPRGRRRAA